MHTIKTCYLCGSDQYSIRPGSVRDKPELQVLECASCGLVYLSDFSHINDAFYEDSGMHQAPIDIHAWLANTHADDMRRFELLKTSLTNKEILDFGCGHAGFLIKAKEFASSATGIELESRLSEWFLENDINVYKKIDQLKDKSFDIITAFHVVEHLPNPAEIIMALSEKLKENGKIIIEVPNANDALLTLYENQAFSNFTYWSCHLYLFNGATLEALARKANLNLDYIKYVQRYPLSNHLHWLAKNTPGGHQVWSFIDNNDLSKAYESTLASLGKTDTLICQLTRK
ncbi:2-polyprenyl-3-methyl-5-hydroxy-6-metoxy-1,4-benzoquinol methylase [Allopseudospirillum japonicum]|uniref:2-polyprenyl-3-methyl-5-hydroxy-6-metoxy-1,4-benzoquinol methylase n=1 Tax=Allopseudospirillum japonicum TaxID=64971 RepID=A0A1H6R4D5_9GAMM|nr:class I SAM-dependent methyltransferase [Allopseudospirillum japonicum]SEI50681.1 2-polyprenyl-3-methyl-5-hydroxy-6-metoxy-1,4-benzoquinol methylase [Allopseudospirillum japonicum]